MSWSQGWVLQLVWTELLVEEETEVGLGYEEHSGIGLEKTDIDKTIEVKVSSSFEYQSTITKLVIEFKH